MTIKNIIDKFECDTSLQNWDTLISHSLSEGDIMMLLDRGVSPRWDRAKDVSFFLKAISKNQAGILQWLFDRGVPVIFREEPRELELMFVRYNMAETCMHYNLPTNETSSIIIGLGYFDPYPVTSISLCFFQYTDPRIKEEFRDFHPLHTAIRYNLHAWISYLLDRGHRLYPEENMDNYIELCHVESKHQDDFLSDARMTSHRILEEFFGR